VTDDEIQEVEDEILRLLDRLRPKDAKEHRRRDAALARVACEAVEALYEIGQPQTAEELLREKCMREINEPPCPMGVKDVAVERIRFPILVSSNERMIPLKGDIIAKMKNMNLGAATGLHLHGAKWEWNRKNRVVIDYLLRLRHLRLQKQRHYPDGWFHDENDADGLAMEETVSKLPEFGPDTWEQAE
jgi:hypothetical protein